MVRTRSSLKQTFLRERGHILRFLLMADRLHEAATRSPMRGAVTVSPRNITSYASSSHKSSSVVPPSTSRASASAAPTSVLRLCGSKRRSTTVVSADESGVARSRTSSSSWSASPSSCILKGDASGVFGVARDATGTLQFPSKRWVGIWVALEPFLPLYRFTQTPRKCSSATRHDLDAEFNLASIMLEHNPSAAVRIHNESTRERSSYCG